MTFKRISPPSLPSGSPTATATMPDTPLTTTPSPTLPAVSSSDGALALPVWQRPASLNSDRLAALLAGSPACLILPGPIRLDSDKIEADWIGVRAGRNHQESLHFYLRHSATIEEAERLLRLCQRAVEPMPRNDLVKAITRLYFLCAVKKEDEDDAAMRAAAYASEFKDMPGDALRETIEAWPKANKFFPSAADLHQAVAMRTGFRVIVLQKLAQTIEKRRQA